MLGGSARSNRLELPPAWREEWNSEETEAGSGLDETVTQPPLIDELDSDEELQVNYQLLAKTRSSARRNQTAAEDASEGE